MTAPGAGWGLGAVQQLEAGQAAWQGAAGRRRAGWQAGWTGHVAFANPDSALLPWLLHVCLWCLPTDRRLVPPLSQWVCRYRAAEEMRQWRARDPVTRFQRWLVDQGWWDDAQDTAVRQEARRWGHSSPIGQAVV